MHEGSFFDKISAKLDAAEKKEFHSYFIKQKRERGLLKTVFDNIRDGIIVIDRKMKILYANNAAKELIGLPDAFADEPISKFLRGIEWGEIMKRSEKEWYHASRQEIEISYPTNRFLLFYLLPHESEKGTAIIILQDITESRKNTEKRLEVEKMEMISLLAAGVAHEIGNPLNSLSLNLQLLAKLLQSPRKIGIRNLKKASSIVNAAIREVARLDSIIRDFLKAVRPSPAKFQKTDIQELVNDVIEFIKEELSDRMILVKCVWPKDIPFIQADAAQMRQAIYNIMRNAMQAMPGGGTLTISCAVNEDFISLAFKDEGQGISPENMGRIFDPYFSTKKDGTGLGLVIVERILREHGASLSVTSEPGKGATFTIVFPLFSKRVRLLPPAPGMEITQQSQNIGAPN